MKFFAAAFLVVALAMPSAALAHAASPQTAHMAAFDKTKFVFDVGTASYAIHHFIYAPFKAGKLHGIKAYVKAALAAAYSVHALKAAYKIANSGNSKLLKAIVSPLNALIGTASSIGSRIKRGDTSQIPAANSELSALSSASSRAGAPFHDVPVSV